MKRFLLSPIWSVLALVLFGLIQFSNPNFLESLKLRYFDQLILNQDRIQNSIYTVNIDDSAIQQRGQWPWPRGEYAALIEDLYNRGAGLVVFNVLMSEVDRFDEDEAFQEILEHYPVVLNTLGSDRTVNEPVNPGAAIINSEFQDLIISFPGVIANIPKFENLAVGSGIVNTLPEIDGVTRRVPLIITSNDILYPNLTLEILRVLAGDPSFQVRLSPLGVDALRIPQFGRINTDELARVWIDWSQTSISVSAADLPDDFGGAIVFVAPTAAGINNPIATAAGGVWPHDLQAALLGTVFNQTNIERPSWAPGAELLAFITAALLIVVAARWTYVGLAFFVLVVFASFGASIYLFAEYKWLIDGLVIPSCLIIVGLVRYSVKFIDEFLQKQAIKKQFGGYASPEVVEMLQKNPDLVKKGVKKEVSICFSDLRGFTPLGESFGDDVKGLTDIMNGYMDAITQPVLEAKGMIIKYIGDASMHIHGAPIDDPHHARSAVRTGLNMLKAVEKFNEKLIEQGRPRVGMGAGINTGIGYIGEMGSTQRHSYDILGDAVSTTARLEGQCKSYGVLLIIGPETYRQTKNDFFYLELDELAVKGKTVGLRIYTVLDDIGERYEASRKKHNHMLSLYREKRFYEAIYECKKLKGHFDKRMDDYYDIWMERCEYMKTLDLPDDWDGIFRATTK
jgi:adenylate cyclase